MDRQGEQVFLRWGLLPLRVVVGLVFLMHGGQKLFVFGLAGTADIMGKLGLPLPSLAAAVVIAAELLGGLAIVSGLYARWAGIALAFEMIVAIFVARLHGGFFAPYGFEFELTLLGACLTFAALGSGGVSLDRMLRRSREGVGRTALTLLIPALLLAGTRALTQQPANGVPDTSAITPAAVETGRAIFHGKGTCFACHGAQLEGSQIAPTLKAHAWRDAKNGQFDEIVRVVTRGVPSTVMVPFPGGISRPEAIDVASYIWSVNNRHASP